MFSYILQTLIYFHCYLLEIFLNFLCVIFFDLYRLFRSVFNFQLSEVRTHTLCSISTMFSLLRFILWSTLLNVSQALEKNMYRQTLDIGQVQFQTNTIKQLSQSTDPHIFFGFPLHKKVTFILQSIKCAIASYLNNVLTLVKKYFIAKKNLLLKNTNPCLSLQ